ISYGDLTLIVTVDTVLDVLKYLRDDAACAFTQLIDVCGVDYPERAERFDVVYHLLSMTQNQRVRVKLSIDEKTAVPSATDLFDSASWFEREAFDLYGILFSGHPDLRRLLTDYGFEGHPLRKDFPLTGHIEIRWDDDEKRVVQEPVTLMQEFRDFDFVSPWEGVRGQIDVLPGDEKAEADVSDEV
ncbi:MAG: NADH-quinone oxidoreductase subunit C, partial [Rhizobiales bacterium]|nr:NADH-quinone oxidoreductase subunit C [Hyphomicrobiales bacterium]